MKNFIDELNEGLEKEAEWYKERGDDYIHKYPDWLRAFDRLRDERNYLLAGIHHECKPVKLKAYSHYIHIFTKDGFNAEDYRYDCGRTAVTYGDRTISSSYLSLGIMRIESAFAKAIQRYGRGDTSFTYEELTNMILTQPHLHEVIKANLIYNLKQYTIQ